MTRDRAAYGSSLTTESNLEPTVSVITVVFNGVNSIERTLQSVCTQSYKKIDYVVIDGGSTDGTQELVARYRSGIASFVSESDHGISDAFNKGLRLSRGDWVLFLNAGDSFVDDDCVSRMVPLLSPEFDLVYGKVGWVTPLGKKVLEVGRPFQPRTFERYMCIPHQAVFHNMDYFHQYGEFSLSFSTSMDYELLLRKPILRVLHVDHLLAFMETGGVSQENPRKVYREQVAAKLLHQKREFFWILFEYTTMNLKWTIRTLGEWLKKKIDFVHSSRNKSWN